MENPAPPDAPLAAALRWAIVISGYVLGGLAILYWVVQYYLYGLPFNAFKDSWWLTQLYRASSLFLLAGPACLLFGAYGLWSRRPWARLLLFAYAGLWVVGLVGEVSSDLVGVLVYNNPPWSWRQAIWLIVSRAVSLGYQSFFAAALCFLLRRTELIDSFPRQTRGFEPLPAEAVEDER